MPELTELIEGIKDHKVSWMQEIPDHPDMTPLVLVEREDQLVAFVFAPQVDKKQGLEAAWHCRKGFAADALTLVCDAHYAKGTKEQVDKWTSLPGSMQAACDNEGLCKTGEITDCLVCIRVRLDGKLQHISLPYFYEEKKSAQFHWLPEEMKILEETDSDVKIGGTLPDAMRRIMREEPFVAHPALARARQGLGMSTDQALYHTARACLRSLTEKGFKCYQLAGDQL